MTNTTTPSMRESFESWEKSFYQERSMTILRDNHWTRGGQYMVPTYESAWEGWQACTALMQPKIDALEVEINELKNKLAEANNDKESLIDRLEMYQNWY